MPFLRAFALGIPLSLPYLAVAQPVYYVSPNGDDAADGLSPQTAWRTLEKVSSTPFEPGTHVLFERGGEWRGRLQSSSSGTPEAPIVYASYGSGPKPRFYGSDILNKSAFAPAAPDSSAVVTAAPQPVGSVLINGEFLRSSQLVTGSSSPSVNRQHVLNTPGTWYRDPTTQQLFINSGTNPLTDPRQYTAVTRDDVVYAYHNNHLIFRDFVVDETAFYDRGYSFRVQGADFVRIENSEAYRAGKHHFGVINSNGFHGKGLYAAIAMPDQGFGGATALVSYSDHRYSGHTSVWEDVLVEDMRGPYPAWYSHGEGIGHVTLRNITSIGSSFSISELTTAYNITAIDANIGIGSDMVVEGVTIKGRQAQLSIGARTTVRNLLIDNFIWQSSHAAPVVVHGADARIEMATITIGSLPMFGQMIALANSDASLELFGAILSAPGNTPFSWSGLAATQIDTDYNLYHNIHFRGPGNQALSLAQWANLTGNDLNSLAGIPGFIDPASGNYNLLPGSIALDRIPAHLLPHLLIDRNGRPRWIGSGIDIGAFEGFTVVPEPSAVFAAAIAGALLLRRVPVR